MDRLHSMRVFARVIEEGSFARAARASNLSPAVVTRLVADLEDHLGARLINRTTRRLVLTDTGELYLERVRAILAEIDEAEAQAAAATAEPHGPLRILAPPAFAVHQLAKHLPTFRSRHPRVTLELSVPGPVETVDDNFDVTIVQRVRPLERGDFVARLLAHAEVIVCASPGYLDRRGRPVHPADLGSHDAVTPPFLRELTLHRGDPADAPSPGDVVTLRPARAALGTTQIDVMYAAALAGLGIAGLPSFLVEDAVRAGRLERVLPGWRLMTSHLYAAMPTRKHVPARTRAFVDFLVQTFGGEPNDPWLRSGPPDAQRPAGRGLSARPVSGSRPRSRPPRSSGSA